MAFRCLFNVLSIRLALSFQFSNKKTKIKKHASLMSCIFNCLELRDKVNNPVIKMFNSKYCKPKASLLF